MKWYPCMKTIPCLLTLLAWLIPLSFEYAASGIVLIGSHNNTMQCIGKEKKALLQFKQGIKTDYCRFLTSWDDHKDCCQWQGIHCNKLTGHVISLHLRGSDGNCYLEGKISPSLLELKHLRYLDLSYHGFNQSIPRFIGSFLKLQHLNLSYNDFHGEIPHQLANLSRLTSLDLSDNVSIYAKSLGWLSHLTLLMDLDLSWVNLSQATDWLQIVNGLPFLRSLHLYHCTLSPTLPSLSYKNSSTALRAVNLAGNPLNDSSILQWLSNLTGISTGLEHLDLNGNGIVGLIPSAFGRNMHSLSYLDLSYNALEGLVPGSIFELKLLEHLDLSNNNIQGIQTLNSQGSLCSLQTLDLSTNSIVNDFLSIIQAFSGCENLNNSLAILNVSNNKFYGSIPNMIGTFSSLEELYLDSNQLNGTVSASLGRLSMLENLDLSFNSLAGTLSYLHFSNLSSLTILRLSNNPELVVSISDDWVTPFQLSEIRMSSCNLGPKFPKWLFNQTELSYLDMSYNGISDTIPPSLWNISAINLSHNDIYGVLPNLPVDTSILVLDLSSNHMEGTIPSFLGYVGYLLLNDNRFFGSVATFLCPENITPLSVIDLSNNDLSGELPDCWDRFEETLTYLRLDNNNFTGKLPPSLSASCDELMLLSMRNNRLSGELHLSVDNCSSLAFLDLGYNSFTGHIPKWIGKTLTNIEVLNLRRNNLSGELPLSLCNLTSLSNLDLSLNHISGTIPKCICNLQGMKDSADNLSGLDVFRWVTGFSDSYYFFSGMIMWKDKEQHFGRTLGLVRSISISDNKLEGAIPTGISCLTRLVSLDLARNNLTGSIPLRVGEMKSLEILDLSSNYLCGEIPSALANLNFLDQLNLSYNNLSGKIPTGTQLQRSDPAAFMGNPGLCGPPLPECAGDNPAYDNRPKGQSITLEEDNDGNDVFPGLYISVALGVIVGFWGVCGTLVIKRSWRHAFFRFVEDTYDRLHVMVAVTIARVRRRP